MPLSQEEPAPERPGILCHSLTSLLPPLPSELDDGVKPRACLVQPCYFTDEETEAQRGITLAQSCVLDTFLFCLHSLYFPA